MTEYDELAAQRFKNSDTSDQSTPRECLNAILRDLDQGDPIRSVFVVVVRPDEDRREFSCDVGHYSAGPDVVTFDQAWRVLQSACLNLIGRMRTS